MQAVRNARLALSFASCQTEIDHLETSRTKRPHREKGARSRYALSVTGYPSGSGRAKPTAPKYTANRGPKKGLAYNSGKWRPTRCVIPQALAAAQIGGRIPIPEIFRSIGCEVPDIRRPLGGRGEGDGPISGAIRVIGHRYRSRVISLKLTARI